MKQLSFIEHGNVYVFEGVDGVGKSTLCSEFSKHLTSVGIPNRIIAFPGRNSGSLGKLVHDIHHNRVDLITEDIHPVSLQTLHLASHIDQIENRIKPYLERGISVVLDRYWWSLYAYGIHNKVPENLLSNLIDIEKDCWEDIKPRIIFYIERKSIFKELESAKSIDEYYKKIRDKESSSNNAITIKNDSGIRTALNKIVKAYSHSATKKHNPPQTIVKSKRVPPSALSKLLKPTVVFDTYWRFAKKRQDIFFERFNAKRPPWTDDPILQTYKFTNAYRASDRVSQYLIKEVIYKGDQSAKELFFRTILFKFFNKIETWELLKSKFGEISYDNFSFKRYDKILTEHIQANNRIYSAAYIMPSGGKNSQFAKKHSMHLDLLSKMVKDNLHDKIAESKSMGKSFELIKEYPSIGDFLAYQYVTDLNYSTMTDFSETDFVIPGPGAKNGMKKCFQSNGGLTESEIIKVVMEEQEAEFERLELDFKNLWGRPLQLIDCQKIGRAHV